MAGRGSRFHAKLDPRKWAAARRAALRRSGYRSELTGLRGRLEVHHLVCLEAGGGAYDLDNLMVLTRAEHIEMHRHDRETPGRAEWRELVDQLMLREPE